MRCDDALPLLYDLADGDIDRDGAIEIAGHVAVCPECAARLVEIRGREMLYRDRLGPEAAIPLRTASELADAVWRNGAPRVPLSADRAPLAFAGACAAAAALALAGTGDVWAPAFAGWLEAARQSMGRAAAAVALAPGDWAASLRYAIASPLRGVWEGSAGAHFGGMLGALGVLLLLQLLGSFYLLSPRRRVEPDREAR